MSDFFPSTPKRRDSFSSLSSSSSSSWSPSRSLSSFPGTCSPRMKELRRRRCPQRNDNTYSHGPASSKSERVDRPRSAKKEVVWTETRMPSEYLEENHRRHFEAVDRGLEEMARINREARARTARKSSERVEQKRLVAQCTDDMSHVTREAKGWTFAGGGKNGMASAAEDKALVVWTDDKPCVPRHAESWNANAITSHGVERAVDERLVVWTDDRALVPREAESWNTVADANRRILMTRKTNVSVSNSDLSFGQGNAAAGMVGRGVERAADKKKFSVDITFNSDTNVEVAKVLASVCYFALVVLALCVYFVFA
mmetsp:Transcript_7450/g.14871  ORF Transcript_7450/g.14871 Transcript_7450/m.14871 type:complete len:313 (+) Transcript_7450:2147-3085(+)